MTVQTPKPCPFCGGSLITKHAGWFDHPNGKCILSGRAFHAHFIWQWNRRADLPPTLSAALTVPEVKALVQLLKEARYDLEVYVDADWPSDLRSRYKSHQSKWDRDMELCRRIDAALLAIEGAADDR